MVQSWRNTAFAIAGVALASHPLVAAAQQSPEWFVPGQQRPPAAGAARAPARPPAPMPQPGPGFNPDAGGPVDDQAPPLQAQQIQNLLPPMPEIPTLPKGSPTPSAIIGILSVPDVLRISTAYQAADKELGQRRQKLNEDAQKEQVALRELGQSIVRDRAKMTPEQIRAKEREYEEHVNDSRRKFGDRNRIIQEAGQYVMIQIERTLEQVAQQVALSRGVNLVLNRAQLLGTTVDFDLTPQVADVLNKILPSVVIPPDGVSVSSLPPGGGGTTASGLLTASPTAPAPVVAPPPVVAPAAAPTAGAPPSAPAAPPAAAPAPPPAAPAAAAKPPQKH